MAPDHQQQQAAAAVRLPDFHADSPQCWFDCLDPTFFFATAIITQSITKFHWVMSKLPFSLIATVRPLSRDPTAVADPYKELKELLLRSYGLSDEQMTNKWLDYPMCGDTRPSVLWDNLTALQLVTIKDAQIALFLRKLPCHISTLINTRAFDTTEEKIQRCNALWMSQTPEEVASAAAAAAAAAPSQQSPFRKARISPSPYRRKTPGGNKSGRRRLPTPGAAKAYVSTTPALATRPTSARRAAPTRKTNRPAAGPHFAAAASPIPTCCPPLCCSTGISHSNVYFSYKKSNFPQRL
jgi:hypothetical protein